MSAHLLLVEGRERAPRVLIPSWWHRSHQTTVPHRVQQTVGIKPTLSKDCCTPRISRAGGESHPGTDGKGGLRHGNERRWSGTVSHVQGRCRWSVALRACSAVAEPACCVECRVVGVVGWCSGVVGVMLNGCSGRHLLHQSTRSRTAVARPSSSLIPSRSESCKRQKREGRLFVHSRLGAKPTIV
jgi:hypothetical protein